MNKIKTVLIVTSHYPPNMGGVESHLQALVTILIKKKWSVVVSTYQPLASSKIVTFKEERRGLIIYRLPWVGFNIFHRLTPYPALEFIFLFPGLFLSTLFVLIRYRSISVIHCQGLVPSAVGAFMKFIFQKKVIASTHNLYFFPKRGLYRIFAYLFFSLVDKVLTPTRFAREELLRIGVVPKKVGIFHYWIDLKTFSPKDKLKFRRKFKWDKFVVFFVGRLIETKGVMLLLKTLESLNKNIQIVIAGDGSLKSKVEEFTLKYKNLTFLGKIDNNLLSTYYSASDLVVVPSTVDEGFGFVVMEAAACGTPVVATLKGGLTESVSPLVGILVKPTSANLQKTIVELYKNSSGLRRLRENCRNYALKHFSEDNVKDIVDAYEG